MESNRRRKRDHEPHPPSPPQTSIESLADDVLGDIFLRLPSLASLARAALACARWRRLATSCDFLHRFRAAHPSPPLIGCFLSLLSPYDDAPISFHRAKICADRDLAAAVRGGDFLLAGLDDERQWRIRDCRHGVLLLAGRDQFALFNPVSRRRINLSRPTHKFSTSHSCILPATGGDGAHLPSFRLVSLEKHPDQVHAHLYISDTGEWLSQPVATTSIPSLVPAQMLCANDHSSYPSMHAAGHIYWKYLEGKVLLSLDTVLIELSNVALLPVPELYHSQELYVVGDTEVGACCLVCIVSAPTGRRGRELQVWLCVHDEETGSWEFEKEIFSMPHACKLSLSECAPGLHGDRGCCAVLHE